MPVPKPKRDAESWADAIHKLENEGACRVCSMHGEDTNGPLEAAHSINQAAQDVILTGPRGGQYMYVQPDAVVPLCSMHHRRYDARGLDLLPYMSVPEQINAVDAAGGIYAALRRLCPLEYGKGAA